MEVNSEGGRNSEENRRKEKREENITRKGGRMYKIKGK